MDWIKVIVESLCEKYGTRDPFKLALLLKIHVTPWNLHHEINGFYQYEKRNCVIFYNANLSYEEQKVVIAHELGHAILHKLTSVPFIRSKTLFSVEKIEREANAFAAHLLIPDEFIAEWENKSINEIASLHEVTPELVKLKCEKLFL